MRLNLKIKQITVFICLATICVLSPNVFAQTNATAAKNKPKAEPSGGNRFLFIVDTSMSMKSGAADVLQTVSEVIDSSASGQLHRGDTLGVWTFNSQLYPGEFPLQTWSPEAKADIAARTAAFLKQQRYGKESRLTAALDGMYTVIKNSDIITVFLISQGQNPMQGTPFDDQINATYAENLKEMKRNRKPIVTVLQAKRGKIIKYTVNALPWPVVIPELPISIKATETIAETPAPEVKPEETTPKPAPAAPAATTVPLPAPTIVEKKPAPTSAVTAAAPTPVAVPAPTSPVPTPAVAGPPPSGNADNSAMRAFLAPPPPAPSPTAQNRQRLAAQPLSRTGPQTLSRPPVNQDNADAPRNDPKVAMNNSRPTPASPATKPAAQSNPPPTKTSAASSDNPPAVASAVARPKVLLIGALVTAAIGFALIALLYHRSRTAAGPSLITQMMNNPRKK